MVFLGGGGAASYERGNPAFARKRTELVLGCVRRQSHNLALNVLHMPYSQES